MTGQSIQCFEWFLVLLVIGRCHRTLSLDKRTPYWILAILGIPYSWSSMFTFCSGPSECKLNHLLALVIVVSADVWCVISHLLVHLLVCQCWRIFCYWLHGDLCGSHEDLSQNHSSEESELSKFFHPSTPHVWGNILEVKNFKKLNPKGVFHPNIFSKIQQFLVITLIEGVSWSVHWPQGVYMRLITRTWWLSNLDFGWKTPLGSWFFEFFDSKKMPSLWAFYWCWKKFHPTFWSVWSHWIGGPLSSLLSQCSRGIREMWVSMVFDMRLITIKWWILKKMFGSKTTFGEWFLKFFTSKNVPPSCWTDGWKKNLIPLYWVCGL